MDVEQPFEDQEPERFGETDLVLDLEGYEGPIDVLLALARDQKVDLTHISILTLAEQYLAFISAARKLRLEIAADYLVMAAWLAYLKSRLLLPPPDNDDDMPSAPELAEALTFQLRRLEAMREAGEGLMVRPRLGRDVFGRGSPEGVQIVRTPVYDLSLYELLKAYGDQRRRQDSSVLQIEASELYSMDDALQRLRGLIGDMGDWAMLFSFLPKNLQGGLVERSAIAATFAAGLEMARAGHIRLRQGTAFGPIYVRRETPTTTEGAVE